MFRNYYIYEVVPVGGKPTYKHGALRAFPNPVSIGDKIKVAEAGSQFVSVAAIYHTESSRSIIYFESADSD